MLYKKDSLKGKAKSITVVLLISRLSFILSSGSFISLILNVSHFSLKAWCSLFFRHWPIPMPTASLTTLYSRASWNCCVATLFLQYFVIKNATESKTIISHKHYIYAQTLQPAYLISCFLVLHQKTRIYPISMGEQKIVATNEGTICKISFQNHASSNIQYLYNFKYLFPKSNKIAVLFDVIYCHHYIRQVWIVVHVVLWATWPVEQVLFFVFACVLSI